MPVVRLSFPRFEKMVGADRKTILDRIPFIGLDIESVEEGSVRVEYSPNRPDYGTDFGIARALRGLLGKEVGLPRYPIAPSGVVLSVDARLSKVRPYIACATATGLKLDEEDVRQIISLQEDLHNGLGRKRKLVAIGLHDLAAVKPPLSYEAVGPDYSFVPLGGSRKATIASILSGTQEGRAYGPALGGSKAYPVITDSAGTVLSFPPIINGDATKVTTAAKGIFVDVTGTSLRAVDDVLAVMATTLAEAGGKLGSATIRSQGRRRETPDLAPVEVPLDLGLVRSLIGLELSRAEVSKALSRSRIAARGGRAVAARYRIDLLHPVDVAEEVALGYGMDSIPPVYPPSGFPGRFNVIEEFLDSSATVMAGAGMVEMMTFELVDERTVYSHFGRPSKAMVRVEDPKSIDHSVLRDALIPSMMSSLAANAGSEYPQRVFEIGRVFTRTPEGIAEEWHLGCLIAHSEAVFSEAKMHLEAFCRTMTGVEAESRAAEHWAFSRGRSAAVYAGGAPIGSVGEVKPDALEAFGLGLPVSGFEIDLGTLYSLSR